MSKEYLDFLTSKIKVSERVGIKIDVSKLHPSTMFHQRDVIQWSLELGRSLVAADCGMGKSHMAIETFRLLHEILGGKYLIVTELGASETFTHPDPEIGEGARLGVQLQYVTNQQEAMASECNTVVTNYERVRNGEFDFSQFNGVWLDEGNYIKNMASETTDILKRELAKVKYKFIATATPSPNETLEIINYAHVLGVCDRGQILTRFFQRNSTKAGELTLHPKHVDDFWLWVSSWAVFITRPSDLGYSDEGYDLPPLNVEWIECQFEEAQGGTGRDGQHKMFRDSADSLPDAARLKRDSIMSRLNTVVDIVTANPEEHYLLWHHLEDERKALNQIFYTHPSYADIFGSQKWETREERIVNFSKGSLQLLATKPELSGVGCNFQKHCNNAIVMGINHSFDDLYQLIKRIHRFGQDKPCYIKILYVPQEHSTVNSLKVKWQLHDEQRERMRDIVLKYGLNQSKFIEDKKRTFIQERKQWTGENYKLINDDCVFGVSELQDNSVDMILTSIPFGNHYEYTDKYNDFGHNSSNEEFFEQMGFLIPELLRVLKPGRIAAIHTKNRIHYGSVTGLGFSTLHRFSHKTADCFELHGFHTIGNHFIQTDVVAENAQTYRLGWTEACKDMTKMGAGIPEEIWIFRKAPSSNGDAYADEKVIHDKAFYSRAKWQIDADAFWGSSGNRLITPEEIKAYPLDVILAWWKKFNPDNIYDYDKHAELLTALQSAGKLSSSFTTLPMQSTNGYIWSNLNRMHGLNMEQSRRNQQNHICPMPFDQVDRLIELYSNPGEIILDPFGGLCTTGVRSIKKDRKAILFELNSIYAKCGAAYMKEEEMKRNIPTLFDFLKEEVSA